MHSHWSNNTKVSDNQNFFPPSSPSPPNPKQIDDNFYNGHENYYTESNEGENDNCKLCNIKIPKDEKAIRCDKCKHWFHIKCIGMALIQYEHYQINYEEIFLCKSCRKCNICDKTIAKNHRKLSCSLCDKDVHIKCNTYSVKDYDQAKEANDFFCMKCISDILPFSSLNDVQYKMAITKGILNTQDTNLNISLTPFQQKLCNELNTMINNNAFDLNCSEDDNDEDIDDENQVLPTINCNYFTSDEFLSKKFISSKNFSIFHLNIHSINRHIEELRIFLQLIEFQFDIICISESKIEDGKTPIVDISLTGYQKPESTPTKATKGGVLIYVRQGLHYKIRNDLNIYKAKELESKFVEIVNKGSANEVVGVIYRHPTMCENEFIDKYMYSIFDKLSKGNKKVYIAGDFNFDLLSMDKHQETTDFFDAMMSNFLLPVINKPTKINRVNNSLIDNIFTNNLHPDTMSGNMCVNFSDGHLPSFLITPKSNQNHLPKKHNFYMRDMKNFQTDTFLQNYKAIDWDSIIEIDNGDVNRSTENFLSKFNVILDDHAPLRRKTQKEYKQMFKPWINNNIIHKIKDKNKMLKKSMSCKSEFSKSVHYEAFKKLKNEITGLIRNSKKEYYQNYFNKNKKNMKKVWKGIKSIINIKCKNLDTPTCLEIDDETITEPKQIASCFNDYFSNVADKILLKRKYTGTKSYRDFLTNRLLEEFVFSDCDKDEVIDIISSLKTNKVYGPHSIPTKVLQSMKNEISETLTKIFNLSLQLGIHPKILRIAKTIPVYKKGSRLVVSNYRPISLLSNINKILEKIVHKRVYKYLEEKNCIYSLQFGFRKKNATNDALIEITEKVRKALDNNEYACGIFVDLQKAFDTVNHKILIKKLEHYGIRGCANNWFASYLDDRQQYVSILGFESATNSIKHGVPQGSVLGPLLFLIYINDLHSAIKFSKVFHFADDTNLLNICKSSKQMQKQMNIDLKILYDWLLANMISLNTNKTEMIVFRKPGTNRTDLKIKMNGYRLIPSEHIKYLGVHIDATLSFHFHCEEISKKLRRANGMLSKTRNLVNSDDLITLYHALFSSHRTYGCQVWGQNINTHTEKLMRIQNRAIRNTQFAAIDTPVNHFYYDLKILKLQDLVKVLNLLFVYKALEKTSPECFHEYFKLAQNIHQHETVNATNGCIYVYIYLHYFTS